MSKAILVMDMPKSCNECDVICMKYYSALHNGDLEILTKPSGCTLRELPEKKQHTLYSIGAYNTGYNACIDDILRGCEENEIN